jgi:hypothetical protein
MKREDIEAGREYAYRAPGKRRQAALRRVKVEALPPGQVIEVSFADGERAGERDAVRTRDLVVPWEEAGPMQRDERALARLLEAAPERHPGYAAAAQLLFELAGAGFGVSIDSRTATMRGDGWIRLAATVGWAPRRVLDDELTFTDRHGFVHAPTALALELAAALIEQDDGSLQAEAEGRLRLDRDEPFGWHPTHSDWDSLIAIREWTAAAALKAGESQVLRLPEVPAG